MTSVFRWNPYRSMAHLNREWENFFGLEEAESAAWLPAIDVAETQDAYVLKADLPGVTREDVKVTLAEEVLTISGVKKPETDGKDRSEHRRERVFGTFTRSFRLPGPVAADRIRAEYRDGVLTLNVPKAESSKPREIQIQ